MNNVEKIVKEFEASQQAQERENYNHALNGLRNGNITFGVDEDGDTIINFLPCDEALFLSFEDYKFIRAINPSLLWYCHNEESIPVSEIEMLSLEDQAQLITKCIEECDCMCSYQHFSGLLSACD